MARTKTSARQKGSSVRLTEHDYSKTLKDRKLVLDTLLDCLVRNDVETFQDVLVAHLRTVSKSKLASETKLGRQTLYDLLDEKKPFNPSLTTLGSILKSLAA
jgi:DNA-binding phage protein